MNVVMSSDMIDGVAFHAHSSATWTHAVVLRDQVHVKVLDGERRREFQSHFTNSMQNGMTIMVSCCYAMVSLATVAKLQAQTTKSMLKIS